MIRVNGIHHIAIMAADIRQHIEFFSDVLGCRLSAIFDMHGVPGGVHAFLHMDDHSYFSVVELPAVKDIPIQLGITHAGTGAHPSAPGTMQHLAFRVDTPEELLAIRDRIRKKGVNVIGPLDHVMCQSIYFAGPDQLTLEVACSSEAINPDAWIDPEVARRVGISDEQMARYRKPDPYAGEGGAVPQPPYDPAKPHQAYPEAMYKAMLAAPDEVITQSAKFEAPVKLAG
ncbi:VOC family protein [Hyphomonas sp.]|uniref:VOC family protein n=1 Tax=Hyphomonas sp. TaxID=87 RepID=UPI003919F169